MKMDATKEAKRIQSRLIGVGLPPISRLQRQFARLGWLAAGHGKPDRSCPVKCGMLRAFWLAGHRHWTKGIGPLPDEKPPLRKVKNSRARVR